MGIKVNKNYIYIYIKYVFVVGKSPILKSPAVSSSDREPSFKAQFSFIYKPSQAGSNSSSNLAQLTKLTSRAE